MKINPVVLYSPKYDHFIVVHDLYNGLSAIEKDIELPLLIPTKIVDILMKDEEIIELGEL